MQKISKKVALALILTAMLSVTITYGAIQYIHYIENQATVIAVYGVKVVKDIEPYDIEVTSINWGNLPPASTKTSTEILGVKCRLRNQDNMDIYVQWRLNPDTSLPAGVTLKAYIFYGADATEWKQGYDPTFNYFIPHGTLGELPVEWRLTIASGTVPQSFSFTIDVLALDSPN